MRSGHSWLHRADFEDRNRFLSPVFRGQTVDISRFALHKETGSYTFHGYVLSVCHGVVSCCRCSLVSVNTEIKKLTVGTRRTPHMEALSGLKNGPIRAFFKLSAKIFVMLSMGYGEISWSDPILPFRFRRPYGTVSRS